MSIFEFIGVAFEFILYLVDGFNLIHKYKPYRVTQCMYTESYYQFCNYH